MKLAVLLGVLSLGACTALLPSAERPVVVYGPPLPSRLLTCPAEPPAIPPPPKPRTVEKIAKWANAEDAALGEARTAIRACHAKLHALHRKYR